MAKAGEHTEQEHTLHSQVEEIAEGIEGAAATFSQYKSANDERTGVFNNFNADSTVES